MGIFKDSGIYKGPGIYNGAGGGGVDNVIGGREYRTVKIGNQTWLAENLDFKFCTIGGGGTPSTPNAWYYNNDEATYGIDGTRKCGLLYNWYALRFLNDNRSELIPGWHVPTNDEWTELANAVGGSGVAGTKLKAIDGAADGSWPSGWNGTCEYGFDVLPAGGYYGTFQVVGTSAIFWTITENGSDAYRRYFDTGTMINQSLYGKSNGFSVRLVKNP